jgi:hypothetical protein
MVSSSPQGFGEGDRHLGLGPEANRQGCAGHTDRGQFKAQMRRNQAANRSRMLLA